MCQRVMCNISHKRQENLRKEADFFIAIATAVSFELSLEFFYTVYSDQGRQNETERDQGLSL